jgi:hypothetical protein
MDKLKDYFYKDKGDFLENLDDSNQVKSEDSVLKEMAEYNQKMIEEILKKEVDIYDDYLTGSVYWFEAIWADGETDSCSGFYGTDFKENGLFDQAGWKH